MDQSNALIQFSDQEIELLKKTICPGANNLELALFVRVCGRLGLDPFARQIYAVFRNSKKKDGTWERKMTIQTSIDGYRLLAQRSKEYTGQEGPWWYDVETKEWTDVWLKDTPPAAAKIGVWRKGFVAPIYAVARYESYVARDKDGNIDKYTQWVKMPEVMIAKVAEALALRRAYPAELSGIYIKEEMDQADNASTVADNPVELVSEKQAENIRNLYRLLDREFIPEQNLPEGTTFEQARRIIGVLTEEYTAFRKAQKTVVVESEPTRQESAPPTEDQPVEANRQAPQEINPASTGQVAFLRKRVGAIKPQNGPTTEAYYKSLFNQPYPGDDVLPLHEWSEMMKDLKDIEQKNKQTEQKAS